MTRRSEVTADQGEQITAAVAAGHEMDGMVVTPADVAAMERVRRGESTIAAERARILDELDVARRH